MNCPLVGLLISQLHVIVHLHQHPGIPTHSFPDYVAISTFRSIILQPLKCSHIPQQCRV